MPQSPPGNDIRLRAEAGRGVISRDAARRALRGSLFDLTCFEGADLVGMGRIVGDGALYFYLQDVVLRPAWRGRGIGRQIVSRLRDEALARAETGATIGLMSARSKEGFYEKLGFQARPTDRLGAGMTRFVLPQKGATQTS